MVAVPKVHFKANHIDIKFTTFNFRLYSGLAIHIEVYHYGKESAVKYSMTLHFLIVSPSLVTSLTLGTLVIWLTLCSGANEIMHSKFRNRLKSDNFYKTPACLRK